MDGMGLIIVVANGLLDKLKKVSCVNNPISVGMVPPLVLKPKNPVVLLHVIKFGILKNLQALANARIWASAESTTRNNTNKVVTRE